MKKIILIISAVLCLTSCDEMIIAAFDLATPDPQFSFLADGEEFKVTGINTRSLKIHDITGEGFAIVLSQGTYWDTENTLESAVISLNCGIFEGSLKKGVEYVYSAEEMDAYPHFKFTIKEKLDASPGTEIHRLKTMWYNASEGWFKITKINKKKGTISGRFEFTAICDDPSNGDIIEITEGVFKDISYNTY